MQQKCHTTANPGFFIQPFTVVLTVPSDLSLKFITKQRLSF
jgi:hypothetical protein